MHKRVLHASLRDLGHGAVVGVAHLCVWGCVYLTLTTQAYC